MRRIFVAVLLGMLGACANPYTQYYKSSLGGKDYAELPRLVPHNGEPTLIRVSFKDVDAVNRRMAEDGFIMVGYSSFNAADVSEAALMQQAKAVKAHTVLYGTEYTNTNSGAMPMTLPNTQTTYQSGSLYGAGGYGSYSGTSTTYGTTTTYIPYSVNRYDYGASFWVKRRDGGLGVGFDNPTAELRSLNGTNKGAMLTRVVRGASAFRADLFEGDVVVRIGADEVVDANAMRTLIPRYYGKSGVEFEVLRKGTRVVKAVDIDQEYK